MSRYQYETYPQGRTCDSTGQFVAPVDVSKVLNWSFVFQADFKIYANSNIHFCQKFFKLYISWGAPLTEGMSLSASLSKIFSLSLTRAAVSISNNIINTFDFWGEQLFWVGVEV